MGKLFVIYCASSTYAPLTTMPWPWSSPSGTLWPQKWPIMQLPSTSRYPAAAKMPQNASIVYHDSLQEHVLTVIIACFCMWCRAGACLHRQYCVFLHVVPCWSMSSPSILRVFACGAVLEHVFTVNIACFCMWCRAGTCPHRHYCVSHGAEGIHFRL